MNTEQNPSEENQLFSNRIDLSKLKEAVVKIKEQLANVIVGQEDFIELLLETKRIESLDIEVSATTGGSPIE